MVQGPPSWTCLGREAYSGAGAWRLFLGPHLPTSKLLSFLFLVVYRRNQALNSLRLQTPPTLSSLVLGPSQYFLNVG